MAVFLSAVVCQWKGAPPTNTGQRSVRSSPREEETFVLQVDVESLHDLIQEAVGVLELQQQVRHGGG